MRSNNRSFDYSTTLTTATEGTTEAVAATESAAEARLTVQKQQYQQQLKQHQQQQEQQQQKLLQQKLLLQKNCRNINCNSSSKNSSSNGNRKRKSEKMSASQQKFAGCQTGRRRPWREHSPHWAGVPAGPAAPAGQAPARLPLLSHSKGGSAILLLQDGERGKRRRNLGRERHGDVQVGFH